MINNDEMQEKAFMSDKEINEVAPSIFTEKPSKEVSKHYTLGSF